MNTPRIRWNTRCIIPADTCGLVRFEGRAIWCALSFCHASVAQTTADGSRKASRPTIQLRIAAHTFNTTQIMVSLPVGAAMMTYSVLRGEDIRLSARAMAITDTIVGLTQSPLGHQISTMI